MSEPAPKVRPSPTIPMVGVLIGAAVLAVAMAPSNSPLRLSGPLNFLLYPLAAILVLGLARFVASRGEFPLCLLAFSFVLTGVRIDTGFSVVDGPQLGILACVISWLLAGGKLKRKFHAVGVAAFFVLVASALSYFGAVDVMQWLKRTMKIALFFWMYLFLVRAASDSPRLTSFIRASLVACAIAGLVLVVHSGALIYQYGLTDFFGPAGTFVNGNEAAAYLAIFFVLGMAIYVTDDCSWLMGRRTLLLLMWATLLGIVATRSRSGLGAALLVTSMFFLFRPRVLRFLLVFSLVAVLAWNVPIGRLYERRVLASFGMSGIDSQDQAVQFSTETRLYMANLFRTVIAARPWFGVGAGNIEFIDQIGVTLPLPPRGRPLDEFVGHSSHNGFINWWVEAGTIGFVPFVATLLCAAWVSWRGRRTRKLPMQWRAVAAGVFGGLAVFVVTNLTGEFGVSEPRYWMLLAMATIVSHQVARFRQAPAVSDPIGVERPLWSSPP